MGVVVEQVCPGLDEAVQTMKVGEVAEIIVQPQHGFGSEQHQASHGTVPPNSTLVYTVELVELHKVGVMDWKPYVCRKCEFEPQQAFPLPPSRPHIPTCAIAWCFSVAECHVVYKQQCGAFLPPQESHTECGLNPPCAASAV